MFLGKTFYNREPSEEQSSGAASEEEVTHREASMYDKLLMSLRSCSKSVDTAYKKRYWFFVYWVCFFFFNVVEKQGRSTYSVCLIVKASVRMLYAYGF